MNLWWQSWLNKLEDRIPPQREFVVSGYKIHNSIRSPHHHQNNSGFSRTSGFAATTRPQDKYIHSRTPGDAIPPCASVGLHVSGLHTRNGFHKRSLQNITTLSNSLTPLQRTHDAVIVSRCYYNIVNTTLNVGFANVKFLNFLVFFKKKSIKREILKGNSKFHNKTNVIFLQWCQGI